MQHVVGVAEDGRSVGPNDPATAHVWRWCRWTRWPLSPAILVVAALTVAFDVTTAWFDITLGHLGRVPVSPTLPLEILLVSMIGFRRLGLDRSNLWAWREFLGISAAVIVFGVYQYAEKVGGFAEAMGLVIAAFDEEMVYRLAVLVLVGSVCARLSGHNWRHTEDWGVGPGVIAVFASGFVFALLPGHVAQMTDTLHALPFVCLGIVLGYAVLRTGALLPAAVVRVAQPGHHRGLAGRDLDAPAHRAGGVGADRPGARHDRRRPASRDLPQDAGVEGGRAGLSTGTSGQPAGYRTHRRNESRPAVIATANPMSTNSPVGSSRASSTKSAAIAAAHAAAPVAASA